MSFVSYAQNFEDIMLWRALKNIEHGFYIDVGAAWPENDSVTNAFYIHGWSGINIEPNTELHTLLENQRTRDINLCVAISDKPGTLVINYINNPGLSTLDETTARKHVADGYQMIRQQVETITLDNVWKTHVPPQQEVHFLKVDVEGFEEAALSGNDWAHNRPWIVVVESTIPMSQQESYEAWEDILTNAGYQFTYADGLNRFYIADEHPELHQAFKYPPNVFDEFVLSQGNRAQQKAERAEKRFRIAEERFRIAEERAQIAISTLEGLYRSRSWRITAPLRWLANQERLVRQHGLINRLKTFAILITSPCIRPVLAFLDSRPPLRNRLISLIKKLGLYRFSRSTYLKFCTPAQPIQHIIGLNNLSAHARCIYHDLESAISNADRNS